MPRRQIRDTPANSGCSVRICNQERLSRHAGFDHPGAELVEKFAIAGDKAALLRQPFRKASRSIR
jgi:hypothetical protein